MLVAAKPRKEQRQGLGKNARATDSFFVSFVSHFCASIISLLVRYLSTLVDVSSPDTLPALHTILTTKTTGRYPLAQRSVVLTHCQEPVSEAML